MFSHNGRISARQVTILLLIDLLNMGILILPRICTLYGGRNGYLLPILAIPLGILYLYSITRVINHFKGATFYEITRKITTKVGAWVLTCLLVFKLVLGMGLELRLFGELITKVMLPTTPLAVILLLLLLSASYLAKSGLEATARLGEVMAYFIFIPLFIILGILAVQSDYEQVMPLFQIENSRIIEGIGSVSLWFMPIELLFIIGGLMREPKEAFRAGSISIILGGIIEAALVIFTLCAIGPTGTRQQIWPVLTLMRSLGGEQAKIEKQEILMITLWIFSTFVYIGSQLCSTSILLSRFCHYKRENVFVLPLVIIIYFIALWPVGLSTLYGIYLNFRYTLNLWFLLIIPLALWGLLKIRRVKDEK